MQDVASRGLDMPKVRWIVQFSAASTAADYVHRVGRTARVNAPGSALVFLAPAEAPYIHMLESHKITWVWCVRSAYMWSVSLNILLLLNCWSWSPSFEHILSSSHGLCTLFTSLYCLLLRYLCTMIVRQFILITIIIPHLCTVFVRQYSQYYYYSPSLVCMCLWSTYGC